MLRTLLILLALLINTSPLFAAKKDNLLESTVGENIHGTWGKFWIDSRQTFTKNSREVMWFGHFRFMTANQANLIIEWFTPAGELFKKEKFTTQWGNNDWGWAKLDIKGKDAAALELEGEWMVKVYWDEDLIDTQKFHMGAKQFAKALTIEPQLTVSENLSTANGYIRLAKAFYAKNEINKAIDALLRAESIEPNSPHAYLILGSLYNATGKPENAILQFSKAQELKADSVAVHRGLANAYVKLNLLDEAIKEYEAIIKIRPNSKENLDKLDSLKAKLLKTNSKQSSSITTSNPSSKTSTK